MTSKKLALNIAKEAAKQRSPQRVTPNPGAQTGHHPALAAIVQQAMFAPGTLSPHDVLQLQRTNGNRAVARLLDDAAKRQQAHSMRQINEPSTASEQETDRPQDQLVGHNPEAASPTLSRTLKNHPASPSPLFPAPLPARFGTLIQRQIELKLEKLKLSVEEAAARYRKSDAGKKFVKDEEFLEFVKTFDHQEFESERAFKSMLYREAKKLDKLSKEGAKEGGSEGLLKVKEKQELLKQGMLERQALIMQWRDAFEGLPSELFSVSEANEFYFKFGMYERYVKGPRVNLEHLVYLIIEAIKEPLIEQAGLIKALHALTSSWPKIPSEVISQRKVRKKESGLSVQAEEGLLEGVEITLLGLVPQLEQALLSTGDLAVGERVFLESKYRGGLIKQVEKDADVSYIDSDGVLHLIEVGFDFGVLYNKLTGKKEQFKTYLKLREAQELEQEAVGALTETELARNKITGIELSYSLPVAAFDAALRGDKETLEKVFQVLVTLIRYQVSLRVGGKVFSGKKLEEFKQNVGKDIGKEDVGKEIGKE
jgi:hypothetical protein